MKRITVLGLCVLVSATLLVFTGCGGGEENQAAADAKPAADAALEELAMTPAPLIDRELFFGDPKISGSQLSHDGKWMSFMKPYKGVRNIWVKGADEPFDSAVPITADQRPVPGYFWSQDNKFILYVQDKGGDENYHVWAVDPTDAADAETGVPSSRDLTPVDGVRAQILSVPRSTPNSIMVGLNDRNPSYHDIYKVDIDTGHREMVRENKEEIGAWMFDSLGQLRLAYRATPGGGAELLAVELTGLRQLATSTYEEEMNVVEFHPNGSQCYVSSNTGDKNLQQLMLMNLETGKFDFVEKDPQNEVDFGGAFTHPVTDELLATFYVGDRVRVYPKTKESKEFWKSLQDALPEGEIGINGMSDDLTKVLASVSSDVDPGSVYLFDASTDKATLQYRTRPELPSEHLANMKPVSYTARDGMKIHGYLTLPKGVSPKNLPVVMYIHGGPWARDHWGYEPNCQFLANRGYAVMQVNYRSSSGYGKEYTNAGNREWGIGAMQHDITDAVNWLIAEGYADADKVAIFGGSYGGYAALAGVTFTPDLFACAIPYVGPSNLLTLINSFPEYWKPFLEGSWYKRVGNPEVEADVEDLKARSPLYHCDQIKVPLLVVHGANDPRVKQHESDQIVVALREKGKYVEYIVADDEGHGFRAPNNRKALAVAMEKFLAKQLGGRLQEDVKPETQKRLDEITVDVKGVVLNPDN